MDTCLEAVSLLDKTIVSGPRAGRKAASDPAFNLAAQLVAAKLNVMAGADATCTAYMNAIVAAQAMLDAAGFNGTSTGTISKANAQAANDLATLLDNYNNNMPCPAP